MYNYNLFINYKELKLRLVYIFFSFILTFGSSFFFKVELFFLISWFFLNLEEGFIYTNLLDPLVLYIKISFLFSIIFIFPVTVYILSFFLFRSIQHFYVVYISCYILSFYLLGIIVISSSYFYLFPFIIKFLLNYQRVGVFNPLKLVLRAAVDKYFVFFSLFLFIFLIIFLVCNIILIIMNLFYSSVSRIYYRKVIYFFFFLILMLSAPPDIFLQLLIFPFFIISTEIMIYFMTFWSNIYILYNKEV
jgi:sec-independent protein translocase protein TatC